MEVNIEEQRDKAMAWGMRQDREPRAQLKRRVRRWLQKVVAGRQWPAEGENEFCRKAVRRHELFWRREL